VIGPEAEGDRIDTSTQNRYLTITVPILGRQSDPAIQHGLL
jgi:hypothetical protein